MKQIILSTLAFLFIGSVSHALEVGEVAPCVVLEHVQTDDSSAEHCIRDKKTEQKFTVIEFFSITCPACTENLPNITTLALSVYEQATTRLVSIDRNKADVLTYIANQKAYLPFEIGLDVDRDAKRAYDVISTPTLYVLDNNNTVVYKHSGVLTGSDILHIQKLIKGN